MDALLEEYLRRHPPRVDLTKEQALQGAEAEGLELLCSGNKAGFVGVVRQAGNLHPYKAQIRIHEPRLLRHTTLHLGYYATAEEAALVYARAARDRAEEAGSAAR